MYDNSIKAGLNRLSREVLTDGFCMLYQESEMTESPSSREVVPSASKEPEMPNFTSLDSLFEREIQLCRIE